VAEQNIFSKVAVQSQHKLKLLFFHTVAPKCVYQGSSNFRSPALGFTETDIAASLWRSSICDYKICLLSLEKANMYIHIRAQANYSRNHIHHFFASQIKKFNTLFNIFSFTILHHFQNYQFMEDWAGILPPSTKSHLLRNTFYSDVSYLHELSARSFVAFLRF